jgi:hypothetical protein
VPLRELWPKVSLVLSKVQLKWDWSLPLFSHPNMASGGSVWHSAHPDFTLRLSWAPWTWRHSKRGDKAKQVNTWTQVQTPGYCWAYQYTPPRNSIPINVSSSHLKTLKSTTPECFLICCWKCSSSLKDSKIHIHTFWLIPIKSRTFNSVFVSPIHIYQDSSQCKSLNTNLR